MNEIREIIAYILIGIGILFNLSGAIGIVRLPNIYNRLQAATKNVTLGTISVLIGAIVYTGFSSIGAKSLICAIFIVLTSPTAAHALARAAYAYGIPLSKNSIIDKYGEDYEKNFGKKVEKHEISED